MADRPSPHPVEREPVKLTKAEREFFDRLKPGSLWITVGDTPFRVLGPPERKLFPYEEGASAVWELPVVHLRVETREVLNGGQWIHESTFPYMRPFDAGREVLAGG